jgi:hypothetical protein
LKVDDDVTHLQQLVDEYKQRTGQLPSSFADVARVGMIGGIPVDPTGRPYKIVDGRVEVADPDALPFITKGLPSGRTPSEFLKQNAATIKNQEDLFAPIPSNK